MNACPKLEELDINTDSPVVIVGLGKTGLSCAKYLQAQNIAFEVMDSRAQPPGLEELKRDCGRTPVSTGCFDEVLLNKASLLLLSPGVSLKTPEIDRQRLRGVPLYGDVELFAQTVTAPVVAITGSNGKSTVTALLAEMAEHAGRKVKMGGNIGTPVLELLDEPDVDLFVLELSSFQLETTCALKLKAAVVLNVTPDHMDRYDNMNEYLSAKLKIFDHADSVVLNKDDPLLSECGVPENAQQLSYGLEGAEDAQFSVMKEGPDEYLMFNQKRLINVNEIAMVGRHNVSNALAALALGYAAGLPFQAMVNTLKTFSGLAHRSQKIAEHNGVKWVDDSKGTNVGATIAAVKGIEGRVVLIAGGIAKDADFSPLLAVLNEKVDELILLGRDAELIRSQLSGYSGHVVRVANLEEAVETAARLATPEDTVLLSPACASFDMFSGFEERGERFIAAVENVIAS